MARRRSYRRRARENPLKTRDKLLIGGGGVVALGTILFLATRSSGSSSGGGDGGGGGGGGGSQSTKPIGNGPSGGKPVAESHEGAGLPQPTEKTTTNPLATQQGVQAALQNPQQFLQDVSNFLAGAAAFKKGFEIVNSIYSAVQSFVATNLNFYLPALDPASFGFLF